MKKCILNDRLIDEDKAFVHVTDLTLLRGYGVFDFFRLEGSKPLYLDDHLDRFFNSADMLRLSSPIEKTEMKSLILNLLKTNQLLNSGVRLVLTGGESSHGYSIGKSSFFALN